MLQMTNKPSHFSVAQLVFASVVSPSIGSALAFGVNIWSMGNKKAAAGLFCASTVWAAVLITFAEIVPDEGLIFLSLAAIIPTMGFGFLIQGMLDKTLEVENLTPKRSWLSLIALSCAGLMLTLVISKVFSW